MPAVFGATSAKPRGERDGRGVMLSRFRGIAGPFRGCPSAKRGAEPVRLLFQCRLKGGERLLSHTAIQQHGPIEFASRRQRSWSHRMFFGFVFSVAGRT